MTKRVLIIGAGMGGLTASLELNRHGFEVIVLEARGSPGGLASRSTFDEIDFDSGPYILLDKPGLEWTFEQLNLSLSEIPLRKIDPVYSVQFEDQHTVQFRADSVATAEQFEVQWSGSAKKYLKFIKKMGERYRDLAPALRRKPNPLKLFFGKSAKHIPFLLRSLGEILRATDLPEPVQQSIGIWTHVAAQNLSNAPAPMAFVPALIHSVGAFYPEKGIVQIPEYLEAIAKKRGVQFRYNTKVTNILVRQDRVTGVETETGEKLDCDSIISNAHGVGTYLKLTPSLPEKKKRWLENLPLQSPGICAYIKGISKTEKPYLQFFLPQNGEPCRLLILPQSIFGGMKESSCRLLMPVPQDWAEGSSFADQEKKLEQILKEEWWQSSFTSFELVGKRLPFDWGRDFHLYRNSMNPVMTAEFMRAGRLAHKSPFFRRLYLAGSSTHPGQWISFAAISGIISARELRKDFH